jgi:leucyl aminopeptidase
LRLVRADRPVEVEADLLILPLVEGSALPLGARALNRALGGALGQVVGGDFKGRFAEVEAIRSLGRLPASRIALLGLGKSEHIDAARLGNALQIGLRAAIGSARSVAVGWTGSPARGISAADVATAAVGATVLVGWTEATHKTASPTNRQINSLTFAGFPEFDRRCLDEAVILAESTNLARDLVNRPASELNPASFAAEARAVARRHRLRCEVLGLADFKRLGYGAIAAAGAGSAAAPRMVVLRHAPRDLGGLRLALVGKGVTFDSGGISIKPAADMRFMRGDMGGAASVLGAMAALARLRLDVDVIGILCCAENMVSATSMRPGDIVRSGAGKTIEVVNTDAEGRMVLADGLHHAVKLGATHVVDIATLTGGQRIALGPVAAMVQGSDPEFTRRFVSAAVEAGERVWEMPTFAEYETLLDSTIADLNNSPGADASAISAGLFLREFSGGLPWIHVDMAAPSWNRVAGLKQVPAGPSGFGVRALTHLAMGMASASAKAAPGAKSDRTSRK